MRILVSGGTGFLGSAVVAELRARGHDVVSLSRSGSRPAPASETGGRVEHLRADLSDELPVSRMGADAYLLCAAYVGADARTAEAVNVHGAERLVRAAQAYRAPVVALSTLSVYGSGPHRGQAEGALEPHPESVASRTRAAAEEIVRASGGAVLRTALTTGAGDRWVVPTLAGIATRLGAPDELRTVRSSVIAAPALARAAAGAAIRLAEDPAGALRARTFHLAHPDPVNLIGLCERLTGVAVPRVSSEAFAQGVEGLGLSPHQTRLLTEDHWYDSTAIWTALDESPGPAIDADPDAVAWYRERLAER